MKDLRGLDTVDANLMWTDREEYLRRTREAIRQAGPVRTAKEADDAAPQGTSQDEEGAP